MIALVSYDKIPPGQFWYQDPHRQKPFQSTPLIVTLIHQVANFRAANFMPRSLDQEVLEDIVAFTCARIGNDPQWCYDTEKRPQQMAPPPPSGCAGCGAQVK